jgi:hypothetical protein
MPPPEPSAKHALVIPTAITAAASVKINRFMVAPICSGGGRLATACAIICAQMLVEVGSLEQTDRSAAATDPIASLCVVLYPLA